MGRAGSEVTDPREIVFRASVMQGGGVAEVALVDRPLDLWIVLYSEQAHFLPDRLPQDLISISISDASGSMIAGTGSTRPPGPLMNMWVHGYPEPEKASYFYASLSDWGYNLNTPGHYTLVLRLKPKYVAALRSQGFRVSTTTVASVTVDYNFGTTHFPPPAGWTVSDIARDVSRAPLPSIALALNASRNTTFRVFESTEIHVIDSYAQQLDAVRSYMTSRGDEVLIDENEPCGAQTAHRFAYRGEGRYVQMVILDVEGKPTTAIYERPSGANAQPEAMTALAAPCAIARSRAQ